MKWRWRLLGLVLRVSAHIAWFLDGIEAERKAKRKPRNLPPPGAPLPAPAPRSGPRTARTWVDGLEVIMFQPACWQAWLTSPHAPRESEVRW